MWTLLLHPTGSKTTQCVLKVGAVRTPSSTRSSRDFCRLRVCLSGQQGWDSNLWERNLDTAPQ